MVLRRSEASLSVPIATNALAAKTAKKDRLAAASPKCAQVF